MRELFVYIIFSQTLSAILVALDVAKSTPKGPLLWPLVPVFPAEVLDEHSGA